MNSTNGSKTEPINKPFPILKKRRKRSDKLQVKVKLKKRKSGTKKKKNNYININNNIINNSIDSISRSAGDAARGARINIYNKKEKEKKEKNKKRKRNLFSNQSYNHKHSLVNKKEPEVTKKMKGIFNLWDNLAEKHGNLSFVKNQKKTSKAYKATCSLVRSFLNGKLVKNPNTVIPKYENDFKYRTSLVDFAEYLFWFDQRIRGDNCERFHMRNGKISLFIFLGGIQYTGFPSILLTWCRFPPKPVVEYFYDEYFPVLESKWASLGGKTKLNQKDYENFDAYLKWAIPHFNLQKKNFTSMNHFVDGMAVLEFFTFGTLKKFTENKQSFSSGILNQEFFRQMIEDLRLFHGYVV